MTLALYDAPISSAKLSVSTDDYTNYNPFVVTFDGRTGGAITKQLYIRNDNLDRYYRNIGISLIDTDSFQHIDGSVHGWEWKLMISDLPPSEAEWYNIDPSNYLVFSDNLGSSSMGDTATYLSFWIRVAVPAKQLLQTIKTVYIRITAVEGMVDY